MQVNGMMEDEADELGLGGVSVHFTAEIDWDEDNQPEVVGLEIVRVVAEKGIIEPLRKAMLPAIEEWVQRLLDLDPTRIESMMPDVDGAFWDGVAQRRYA